jgi:hypothetical protein
MLPVSLYTHKKDIQMIAIRNYRLLLVSSKYNNIDRLLILRCCCRGGAQKNLGDLLRDISLPFFSLFSIETNPAAESKKEMW